LQPVQPVADPVWQLTEREREILALMATGRSNDAISATLTISPKTLERHIRHIFVKLGLAGDRRRNARVCAVLMWCSSPHGAAGDIPAPVRAEV
jgi:DNA-binding CsgD family transcriptional regulator